MSNVVSEYMLGTALATAIFAGNIMPANLASMVREHNDSKTSPVSINEYYSVAMSGEYGGHRSAMTGDFKTKNIDFEQTVSNFYSSLLSTQTLLDHDFEKILSDNLWSLYTR